MFEIRLDQVSSRLLLQLQYTKLTSNFSTEMVRYTSMKDPDTANSNMFPGTVYFKNSNSEIPQAVDFWLVVFNHMTST